VLSSAKTIKGAAARFTLVVLGIFLIAAFVIIWKFATDAATIFIQNLWCTSFGRTNDCQFRGYQHFLIWTVAGIINLLIMGFLCEKLADYFRRD
jgi:hypothetical protein